MTDLTEQWKKGELPEGHYYIKTRSETNIDEYIQWYKDHGIPSEKSFAYFNVQQVLAPVPSYEEWQASYNCMLENEVLRLKNAQLKELLKEWVQFEIEENPNDFTVMSERMSELANKTKEVLK